jgi:hypothetical protein
MARHHAFDNLATNRGTTLRGIRRCAKTLNLLRAPGIVSPPPLLGSRKIRLGFYVINLTNHGNFNQVYNNVASPNFGRFTEFERRQTAFLLSVVN